MTKLLFSAVCALLILFANYSAAENTSQTLNKTNRFINAALIQTKSAIIYNGTYFKIAYPMGDVPAQYGVCTDVIVRAYRQLGIDLQQLVHEDMRNNFALYPAKKNWGQTKTDSNIDHRRVPNLQTFFTRHGKKIPTSNQANDYQPGDIVTWILPGNLPHIGIVSDKYSADGQRPLIVHNIGAGPKLEDMLFAYTISGHYRYALF